MQTTARQVSHGVIQIETAVKAVAVAPSFAAPVASASPATHAVAAGDAPAPVVQHKTTAQIEQEAAQLAADVAAAK